MNPYKLIFASTSYIIMCLECLKGSDCLCCRDEMSIRFDSYSEEILSVLLLELQFHYGPARSPVWY